MGDSYTKLPPVTISGLPRAGAAHVTDLIEVSTGGATMSASLGQVVQLATTAFTTMALDIFLPLTGGTLSGPLQGTTATFSNAPAYPNNSTSVATTSFVMSAVTAGGSGYLPLTGGTLSNDLLVGAPATASGVQLFDEGWISINGRVGWAGMDFTQRTAGVNQKVWNINAGIDGSFNIVAYDDAYATALQTWLFSRAGSLTLPGPLIYNAAANPVDKKKFQTSVAPNGHFLLQALNDAGAPQLTWTFQRADRAGYTTIPGWLQIMPPLNTLSPDPLLQESPIVSFFSPAAAVDHRWWHLWASSTNPDLLLLEATADDLETSSATWTFNRVNGATVLPGPLGIGRTPTALLDVAGTVVGDVTVIFANLDTGVVGSAQVIRQNLGTSLSVSRRLINTFGVGVLHEFGTGVLGRTHDFDGHTFRNSAGTLNQLGIQNQQVIFYGTTSGQSKVQAQASAPDLTITLPASTGTLALTTQIPTTLPPNGAAGGDLSGTYPNPTIKPSVTNGQVLTTVGGVSAWATPSGGGGGGTVTSTSVVSANGLAGTVATATTTPAITLSTTITGMLKGNGTAISAGVAGTDYMTPANVSGAYLPIANPAFTGTLTGAAATLNGALTISMNQPGILFTHPSNAADQKTVRLWEFDDGAVYMSFVNDVGALQNQFEWSRAGEFISPSNVYVTPNTSGSGYYIAGSARLVAESTDYTSIRAPGTAVNRITVGDDVNPTNYYTNDVHIIRDRALTNIASLTTTAATFSVPVSGTTATFSGVVSTNGFTAGYLAVPQNIQASNYAPVLADSGKHIYHASGAAGATWTIPANSTVAYPIGTTLTFVNDSANNIAINITTDTLVWSPGTTTGFRTLGIGGIATALKVTATRWLISGTGLT
jgi:hypothetical protein